MNNPPLHISIAATCILFLSILSGCGSQPTQSAEPFGGSKNANASTTEALAGATEQVQSLYKQSCLSCHGNTLEGRIGPNTNLQQVGKKLTKEQISKQIANGGNGMPSFGTKLTAEEIQALTEWLSTKK
jgi:cytochrome c551